MVYYIVAILIIIGHFLIIGAGNPGYLYPG